MIDIDKYLARIEYAGTRDVSYETFCTLHQAHIRAVPFENLDVINKVSIYPDTQRFYAKIVEAGRGGFCYELNGLFNELLLTLGFHTTLLSARVIRQDGHSFGPEFDHLCLKVDIDGKNYLADVGYGDNFYEPLLLHMREIQYRKEGSYLLSDHDGEVAYSRINEGGQPEIKYVFTLTPRRLEDFSATCYWQQTSPDSTFTREIICSIVTPEGRVTVRGNTLVRTVHGKKTMTMLTSPEEVEEALLSNFGFSLTQKKFVR